MHQNLNNKRTYNTSGKSVVVVVKTKSQEMNTFRVRTVDMPGKCIIKIGLERVKFKSHGTVKISLQSDKLFRNWKVHKNDKATAIPLKIKHLTAGCIHKITSKYIQTCLFHVLIMHHTLLPAVLGQSVNGM
jgi:hypothetical protein